MIEYKGKASVNTRLNPIGPLDRRQIVIGLLQQTVIGLLQLPVAVEGSLNFVLEVRLLHLKAVAKIGR